MPPTSRRRRRGSLTLDATTAELVRRTASWEGRPKDITGIVNDMLLLYIRTNYPDVKLSFDTIPDEEERLAAAGGAL